ncbi:MAG: hypothetical protein KF774_14300 [Planctomyces sp.]|nr:hypothetical protein [Planctomyces sp.]
MSESAPADRPSNAPAPRPRHWLWPTFAVLFAAVGVMTSNGADPDLWGHYQYGKEALRDGELATTTTWSYAVEGHPWVNHENLAEIATAWTADRFGIPGLTIGKLLLAIVIFGCAIWSCRRRGAGWATIGLVAILAADNIRFHWQFRPHAWTYAYFAVMVLILGEAFAGWQGVARRWREMFSLQSVDPDPPSLPRLRLLWLLPPLMFAWTNTHGGFAAGLAIACSYLGMRMLQGWNWWGRASIPRQLRIGMMIAATILASLMNPYGPGLHLWMLDTLGAAPPEIGDWAPLPIWTRQATGFWLLIAVVGFSLLRTSRRRDPVQLCLLALTLWQGLSHCRHICFFAIFCAFWMPAHLQSAIEPIRNSWRATLQGREPSPVIRRVLGGVFVLWLGMLALRLGPQLSTIPVERSEYPVSAMQFLRQHDLRGRTMVTFNWAQYAIACFAQDSTDEPSRVAIDGRLNTCYPRPVLDIYLDFLLGEPQPGARLRARDSAPYDPTRALTYQEPDLFLLDRGQQPAIRTIMASPEWVLLYQDSLAQVWGRRDRYDDPASPDYFPPQRRSIGEMPQVGAVAWPAFPKSPRAAVVASRP